MKFRFNLNWFLRVLSLGLVARLLFPTKVVGKKLIPNEPFVLVIGPHKSAKETVLVPASLWGYEFHIMAKAELFKVPIFGWIFKHAGGIPVFRKNGRGADSIEASVKELQRGFPIMVFPEGTRFDDGALHTGKTGAFRIALEADAPIVLALLEGMAKRDTKTKRTIRIVGVFHPRFELNLLQQKMVERLPEGLAARLLTDRMMQRLVEGTGTPYISKDERGDQV
jgi:1-acyl-sn-glycerol-3-phosphate acyltransferase